MKRRRGRRLKDTEWLGECGNVLLVQSCWSLEIGDQEVKLEELAWDKPRKA